MHAVCFIGYKASYKNSKQLGAHHSQITKKLNERQA